MNNNKYSISNTYKMIVEKNKEISEAQAKEFKRLFPYWKFLFLTIINRLDVLIIAGRQIEPLAIVLFERKSKDTLKIRYRWFCSIDKDTIKVIKYNFNQLNKEKIKGTNQIIINIHKQNKAEMQFFMDKLGFEIDEADWKWSELINKENVLLIKKLE
jgi:hypothetical protein